jgi:hypothetical protein
MNLSNIQQLYLAGLINDDQARRLIEASLSAEGRVGGGPGQLRDETLERHIGVLFSTMLEAKERGDKPTLTTEEIGGLLNTAQGTAPNIVPPGAPAPAADTLFRDPIISEPSLGQAFSRFIGGTPFAATPGLTSAAAAMRPIAQTQFQLQPSTPVWDPETGELQPRDIGEFSRFLPGGLGGGAGGSFLRGQDLSDRLSELTRALYRSRGEGDNPINPFVDTRQAQLFQEFGDPQNTFSAFQLPSLMGAQGRGRALLSNAFDRFRNRWLGENPNATGYDVANLFGRYSSG